MKIVESINSGAFNQISTICASLDEMDMTREAWRQMGYRQWTMDYCRQTGPTREQPIVTAVLAFNFDIIPGFQYELLCWQPEIQYPWQVRTGSISHMAYYTQDVETDVKDISAAFGVDPWYKFVTLDHSNPALQGKTRFKEAVWYFPETHMGFKAVQKIPWNSSDSWEEFDVESPVDTYNRQLMSNIKEAGMGG